MALHHILTRILCLSALILHTTLGKDLSITFTGELSLYLPTQTSAAMRTELLKTKVVSKVSANANFAEECVEVDSLEYQADEGNSSYQAVSYAVTIKQKECLTGKNLLTVTEVCQLGITSFSLHPAVHHESEFWQDKMNSILVFGGCAAVLIIMLVTCLIMTTGCYKRNTKNKKQIYTPSKQRLYQPYAIDTMTMDHRKYSRKENFQSIKEGKQYEPTTIERWVNSQLSKGRRQSSAIDLNKEGKKGSDFKTNDSHHNLSITDSGIVTTVPRGSPTESDYTSDQTSQIQIRHGIAEGFLHAPLHVMCNSIGYVQHSNAAYGRSVSNDDHCCLEESSQL